MYINFILKALRYTNHKHGEIKKKLWEILKPTTFLRLGYTSISLWLNLKQKMGMLSICNTPYYSTAELNERIDIWTTELILKYRHNIKYSWKRIGEEKASMRSQRIILVKKRKRIKEGCNWEELVNKGKELKERHSIYNFVVVSRATRFKKNYIVIKKAVM